MEIETIGLPFEIDEVLDIFAPKDINIVCFRKNSRCENIILFKLLFHLFGVWVNLLLVMRSYDWKKNDLVFYLVHFIDLWTFLCTHWFELIFMENISIVFPYFKYIETVASHKFFITGVNRWPFIKINRFFEHIRI